jgi:uncharacterized protein (DUF433 family)
MAAYKGTILDVIELYKDGLTIEDIAKSKGLTIEEVEKIIKEYS